MSTPAPAASLTCGSKAGFPLMPDGRVVSVRLQKMRARTGVPSNTIVGTPPTTFTRAVSTALAVKTPVTPATRQIPAYTRPC